MKIINDQFSMPNEAVEIKAIFEANPSIPVVVIIGIALNSDNAKKEYEQGEALDVRGLFLIVSKSDGSTERVDVTADMVSNFESKDPGEKILTVTYSGFSTTYKVEVRAYPPVLIVPDYWQYEVTEMTTNAVIKKGKVIASRESPPVNTEKFLSALFNVLEFKISKGAWNLPTIPISLAKLLFENRQTVTVPFTPSNN